MFRPSVRLGDHTGHIGRLSLHLPLGKDDDNDNNSRPPVYDGMTTLHSDARAENAKQRPAVGNDREPKERGQQRWCAVASVIETVIMLRRQQAPPTTPLLSLRPQSGAPFVQLRPSEVTAALPTHPSFLQLPVPATYLFLQAACRRTRKGQRKERQKMPTSRARAEGHEVHVLEALPSLRELDIDDDSGANCEDGYVTSFLRGLTRLTSLKKKVDGNMLMFWSDEYSNALVDAFQSKFLQLESVKLVFPNPHFWETLVDSGGIKSLKHLCCEDSEATKEDVESMVRGVVRGFPQLKEFDLDLVNNDLYEDVTFDFILSHLQELKGHETLKNINVFVGGFYEGHDEHTADKFVEKLRQVVGEGIKVAVRPDPNESYRK